MLAATRLLAEAGARRARLAPTAMRRRRPLGCTREPASHVPAKLFPGHGTVLGRVPDVCAIGSRTCITKAHSSPTVRHRPVCSGASGALFLCAKICSHHARHSFCTLRAQLHSPNDTTQPPPPHNTRLYLLPPLTRSPFPKQRHTPFARIQPLVKAMPCQDIILPQVIAQYRVDPKGALGCLLSGSLTDAFQ